MDLTKQQQTAIERPGKVIVSASAGSGKTFVMIQKLIEAIKGNVDLDNVLAITFTKKAAAQMKDKLRTQIIEHMKEADAQTRKKLKLQLTKIPSSNISTIHSFCGQLLRTYFYTVGIDGTFDIIASDSAEALEFKARALDTLFEQYYDSDNADFKTLLTCYRKSRSDKHLRELILDAYDDLRVADKYKTILEKIESVYTEQSFDEICARLKTQMNVRYERLRLDVERFAEGFTQRYPRYTEIFKDMANTLKKVQSLSLFEPLPDITNVKKPADSADEKSVGEEYSKYRAKTVRRYSDIRGGIADRQTEYDRFLASGKTAIAFAHILKDFDREYTALKNDDNKLDYNDLEHLTIELLENKEIQAELSTRFTHVFVDEYQDVNPVQEKMVSLLGGQNVFMVGDVKQAIYGFRGSKSLFFAEKYNSYAGGGEGSALRLSNNFRSSDGVLDFVNKLFCDIMTTESCGFNYADGSKMIYGGFYPKGYGTAQIHVFGKDEKDMSEPEVYSVKADVKKAKQSREGLAVLKIVESELKSQHYDLKKKAFVDTRPGDICILTRKRNKNAECIARALTDAGYSVSGELEQKLVARPEVKQMIDILSYIDNIEQDIPMATAMLSPIGRFTCDELAAIRIAAKGLGKMSFRECCKKYRGNDVIARKLNAFYQKTEFLRDLAEVLTAAEFIDKLLEDTYLEASYSAGNGDKLKNIRKLAAEGVNLSISGLLRKIESGYKLNTPSAASSDSIKIMTMHSSKGLEFPVVILSDICATYKGTETYELPFNEEFGFAPKCYDSENMVTYDTLLRRLTIDAKQSDELKNEFNLFYVACTRAMCNLHIMAKEKLPFNPSTAAEANAYAKFFDMEKFGCDEIDPADEREGQGVDGPLPEPDQKLVKDIEKRFRHTYAAQQSINLPVKSSASAILSLNNDESVFRPHEMYGGEGETGTARGSAYHRFLELCDFAVTDVDGIQRQLDKFVADGRMGAEQRELIEAEQFAEILSMPVFSDLSGATLWREREFLCMLPANELFDTGASDGVLVQGAIDLLALTKGGYKIVDYKYSHKSDDELVKTYSPQLALYKKAVALIMQVNPATIKTSIVNIFKRSQIDL